MIKFPRFRIAFMICLLAGLLPGRPAEAQNLHPSADKALAYLRSCDGARPVYTYAATTPYSFQGREALYITTFTEGGFVITSADQRAEILAYSTRSHFDASRIPAHVAYVLDRYAAAQAQQTLSSPAGDAGLPVKSTSKSVNPLCTSRWGQNCFYNEQCPYDTLGPCDHAVTGCVATAMAQIMYYWKYPVHGSGVHTYNHYMYGNLSADFGAATYDWASMSDSLAGHNAEVAELNYHCGVATDMDYGPGSSGGLVNAESWEQYFRYSLNAELQYRSEMDSADWVQTIIHEMDAGRPVLYVGFPKPPMPPVGHAWVCDGYDMNGFLHFNWGWDGTFDGYFQMGAFVYSESNFAVTGIMPVQQADICVIESLFPAAATFTDPVPLRVRVANYDTAAHWGIPLYYRIDGATAVWDTITDTIPPLQEIVFEFGNPCDLSASPGHFYQMEVVVAETTDAFRENDTLRFLAENVVCALPPYTMGFESTESFSGWSMEDIQTNGNCWYFGTGGGHSGTGLVYSFVYDQPADDWLFSRCLDLDSGQLYRLSFWCKSNSLSQASDFELWMGQSPSASAMNNLVDSIHCAPGGAYQELAYYFSVPVDGHYYAGWHLAAPAFAPGSLLDDFSISPCEAPDAGITALISPQAACDLSAETLTVEVRNFSSQVMYSVPLSYRLNGGPVTNDTIWDTLSMGEAVTFSFQQLADLSAGGDFEILVWTELAGDSLNTNDTLRQWVRNVISPLMPYSMGFEPAEDLSDWSIENTNADAYAWHCRSFGGRTAPWCAIYEYSSWIAADDWLFSKCVYLEAGTTYRLDFWYKVESDQWHEDLSVWAGNAPMSQHMDLLIADMPGLLNMTYLQSQHLFTVPAGGHYYLGWKCYSPALMFNLYLDDISLQATTVGQENSSPEGRFSLSPNPSTDGHFLLELAEEPITPVNLKVFDLTGRCLLSLTISRQTTFIDLSETENGLYFFVLDGLGVEKVMRRR